MTLAAYDSIADWYDQSIRKGTLLSVNEMVVSACFEIMGSIEGQSICDLACGQGDMARQMAKLGARVTGVDLSRNLLEIAKREEAAEPLGIAYLHDDAQSLASIAEQQFDAVICHLALMDIPDLSATACNVKRILRPNGRFVASITHPCFQTPPNRDYYDEGFWRSGNPTGVRGQVGAIHRTLGAYVNAFGEAGLFLERMAEPPLPNRNVPPILIVQCRSFNAERE